MRKGSFLTLVAVLIGMFLLGHQLIPLPGVEGAVGNEVNKISFKSPFVLHFNQKMNRKSVEEAFSIHPNVRGEWKWQGGKTLEYHPNRSLKIGENYRILIDKEARSLYGKPLGVQVSLDFLVTGAPFVSFVTPFSEEEIPVVSAHQPITVMFDRPMDFSKMKEVDLLSISPKIPGKITFLGASAFQFLPEKWPLNQTFTLNLPSGLSARSGGLTEEEKEWRIRTPGLRVIGSSPLPEERVPQDASLHIVFNQAVDLGAVKPGVNVLLFPSNDLDADTDLKEDGFFNAEVVYGVDETGEKQENVLIFKPTFPYQPDTKYRLEINADFAQLEMPFSLPFKTLFEEEKEERSPALAWQPNEKHHLLKTVDNPQWTLKTGWASSLSIRLCPLTPEAFIEANEEGRWEDFPCTRPPKTFLLPQDNQGVIGLRWKDFFEEEVAEGIYLLMVQTPEGASVFKTVVVSDLMLVMEKKASDLLVWAFNSEGKVLPRLPLKLFNYEGELLKSGVTNENGVYQTKGNLGEGLYIMGGTALAHEYWPLSNLSPVSEGEYLPAVYLMPDKNTASPGDTIHLKGLWRLVSEALFTLPLEESHVTMTLENQGITLFEQEIPLRRNGSFDGSLKLPVDAPPGTYELHAHHPSGSLLSHNQSLIQITPPEIPFLVEWVTSRKQFESGTVPLFQLNAHYRNGFPATHLSGFWELYSEKSTTPISRGELVFDLKGGAKILLDHWGGAEGFLPLGHYKLVAKMTEKDFRPSLVFDFTIGEGAYRTELHVKHLFLSPGREVEVQISHLDENGLAVFDKKTTLSLLYEEGGREKIEHEESFTVEENKTRFSFDLPEKLAGGKYLLRAESRDNGGNLISSEKEVYVLDKERNALGREMNLLTDQSDYLVGGKARLMINHPEATAERPVPALVVYEQGGLLTHDFIMLQAFLTPLDIPITPQMVPMLHASVFSIQKGLLQKAELALKIRDQEQEIFVDVTVNPQEPSPGDEVTLHFQAHDYQNRPLRSVLTLNVTDRTAFNPSLLSYFLEKNKGSILENPFDSAYFNPLILTDEQGKAAVSFTLPEKMTQVYAHVLATREAGKFGNAVVNIPTKTRLQITPVAPDFIGLGDTIFLRTKLNNLSDDVVDSRLELIAPLLKIKGSDKRNFSLKPGESTTVYWEVVAEAVGEIEEKESVKMIFRSREDSVSLTLPIKKLKYVQSILPQSGEEVNWSAFLNIGTPILPEIGSLTFSLSASPINVVRNYGYLLQKLSYPFTETFADRLFGHLFADGEDETLLAFLVEQLSDLQRSDGGFTVWQGGKGSDLPLSAYVLFALTQSEKQGGAPDAETQNTLISFLWNHLDSEELSLEDRLFILWALSEAGQYDTETSLTAFQNREEASFEGRGFLLMNLSNLIEAGQKSVLPFRERLLAELTSEKTTYENLIYFEEEGLPENTLKNTAIMLFALEKMDPDNVLVLPLVRTLTSAKTLPLNRFDPRTAVWNGLALSAFSENKTAEGGNTIAQVKLDNKTLIDASINPQEKNEIFASTLALKEIKNTEKAHHLTIEKNGKGNLYFQSHLSYFPQNDQIPSAEEGLILTRLYRDPETGQTVTQLEQGRVYEGELRLIVPRNLSDVILEEALPAGLKALSLNAEKEGLTWMDHPLWYFDNYALEKDRILLYAQELPAGSYTLTYRAQAGLMGQFNQLPARAYPLYQPEIYGQTPGRMIEISE